MEEGKKAAYFGRTKTELSSHEPTRLLGERERSCVQVLIGATADGTKELIAIQEGRRESELSWKTLLLDCQRRGLDSAPELATADGGLGFWAAMSQVWSTTREQRCWVHKTANASKARRRSMRSWRLIKKGSIRKRPSA